MSEVSIKNKQKRLLFEPIQTSQNIQLKTPVTKIIFKLKVSKKIY